MTDLSCALPIKDWAISKPQAPEAQGVFIAGLKVGVAGTGVIGRAERPGWTRDEWLSTHPSMPYSPQLSGDRYVPMT